MTERLVVARIRGLHGLRGDVRIEILTDQPERRFRPGVVLFPEGEAKGLTVASSAEIVDGPGWRVRFRELPDRTAVEGLRDRYLEVEVGPEDRPAEGSFYWHELIGLRVTSPDGAELGTVHDVYEVGETEAVVVRGGPAGEFDIPLVRALIAEFDPPTGRFVVDPAVLDLSVRRPLEPGARPRAPRRRQGSRRGATARPAAEADAPPATDMPASPATEAE